jgi:sugar/nucleoside kinase (ribokinase family)
MALNVAVIGYASADRAVAVDALPAADTTAVVRRRLGSRWPRLGGCGPQIALGLARAGVTTSCLTWLADDAVGAELHAQLREAGADTRGVTVSGTRTAESFLVYDPAGHGLCFFDPGDANLDGLGSVQREIVAHADVLCLTVASAPATRDALAAASRAARVVWSVKADPDAYPPDLVGELLTRAEVVWHSAEEAAFLAEAEAAAGVAPRSDALVIETQGAEGVRWRRDQQHGHQRVPPLSVSDTTGAGDAFVAGSLARLLVEPMDHTGAVRAGVAASRALLEAREKEE